MLRWIALPCHPPRPQNFIQATSRPPPQSGYTPLLGLASERSSREGGGPFSGCRRDAALLLVERAKRGEKKLTSYARIWRLFRAWRRMRVFWAAKGPSHGRGRDAPSVSLPFALSVVVFCPNPPIQVALSLVYPPSVHSVLARLRSLWQKHANQSGKRQPVSLSHRPLYPHASTTHNHHHPDSLSELIILHLSPHNPGSHQ